MVGQPAKVGRGLRTIALNIAAMAEKTDTWTAASGKVKVALKDQNGEMRSTYDIMKDLYTGVEGQSEAWNSLSKAEKTTIGESAAGKNQFEVFSAVMGNFENAIKATNTALHSTGSAEKENRKAMDSIEGRLQKLRSSFEYFAYKTINSDFIKSIISAGTTVLNVLGSDMGQASLKFAATATGVGLLGRAFTKLHGVVKGLSATDAFKTLIFGSKSVKKATEGMTKATKANTAAEMAADIATGQTVKTKKGLTKVIRQNSTEMVSATKKTSTFGKAWGKIGGLITAHPFLAATAGIAATTLAVTKFADKYNEVYSAYDKTANKVKKYKVEIQQLINKEGELTEAEGQRLLQLQTTAKALEKQSKKEAKTALDKATAGFFDKDGNLAGSSGVGKAGVQDTGMKKLERDTKLIGAYQDQLQKYNAELEKGGDFEKWEKGYKNIGQKIQDVAGSYDKQIKAFEDAEKAGIPLTDQQKQLWEGLKKIDQASQDVTKDYKDIKSEQALLAQAEEWIPDANKLSKTETGMAILKDRMHDLNLAMNRTGKDGQESFTKMMKGIEGGFKDLGKYDKDTGVFTFDNANIEDYAKSLGVTEKAAQKLLSTQTKAGKIKWDFPESDLKNFNNQVSELPSTMQRADKSMVASKQSLTNLAQSLNIPNATIPSFIAGFKDAGNAVVDLSAKTPNLISQLSKIGDQFGISMDKAGKSIKSVDIGSLTEGMVQLGATQGDVTRVIGALSQMEGVKIKGDWGDFIKGSNTAEKAAKDLYNSVKKTGKAKASPKVEAKGVEKTQKKVEKTGKDVKKLDGKKATVHVKEKGSKNVEKSTKKAKRSVEKLDGTEGKATLKADDKTGSGVSSAKGNVGSFDGTSWEAILQALNQVQPGIGAALGLLNMFAGVPFMATLAAQDNASAPISNVQGLADALVKPYTASLRAQDGASGTINSVSALLNSLNGKTAYTYVKTIKTTEQRAKGKKRGEKGGTAWVGDEGTASNPKPELIETKNGAYLAGTKGWELVNLETDDIVHTASETKRLLAGKFSYLKEAANELIPRFAKGKKGKKKKKKKTFKDKVDNVRESFDRAVETLEYKRDYNNWSDEYFNKRYQKLYNKYQKKARKIKKGKKRGSLSIDQKRDVKMAKRETAMENAVEGIEESISKVGVGTKSVKSAIAQINKIRKARKISAEEAKEYKKEVYKAAVDYNLKEFKNGKKTFAQLKAAAEQYYKAVGKDSEEYYEMQEELAEAAKERELDRLEELKEKEDKKMELAELYVDKQISAIDKQIEAEEKENEVKEKGNELAELEAKLAQAKSQRVRIYREGVGFVYEQDLQAIKEAKDEIEDFKSEEKVSELEKLKEQWENVAELFEELQTNAQIDALEKELGASAEQLFGGLGTDLDRWTPKVENILAQSNYYQDLINKLEKAEGYSQIMGLLGSDGLMGGGKIAGMYASGTTFASGGLSLVGEKGAELRVLNQGDGIIPADLTANLMAIGQLNPTQWENLTKGNISEKANQSNEFNYSFDKLVLPNVKNADNFINELKQLPNKAVQSSRQRW